MLAMTVGRGVSRGRHAVTSCRARLFGRSHWASSTIARLRIERPRRDQHTGQDQSGDDALEPAGQQPHSEADAAAIAAATSGTM